MAAVLQTVLDDFQGSAYRRARGYGMAVCALDARQAIAYVASTDRTWPFSFENVCDALDLCSVALRRQLAGMRRLRARSAPGTVAATARMTSDSRDLPVTRAVGTFAEDRAPRRSLASRR